MTYNYNKPMPRWMGHSVTTFLIAYCTLFWGLALGLPAMLTIRYYLYPELYLAENGTLLAVLCSALFLLAFCMTFHVLQEFYAHICNRIGKSLPSKQRRLYDL